MDRNGFWLIWPLFVTPWPLAFFDPFIGLPMLFLFLYPVACLFSKRMRDMGGRARWLTPLWIVLSGLIVAGGNSYLTAAALASLSAWPGGRGLLDFGDMGGLYEIGGAGLLLLVASLIVGAIPGDDGSKTRNVAARTFD